MPTLAVPYLDRILGSLNKLPPFDPVVAKVLASLADEDVSFGEVAGIIETDTVLAGNLLRVVNSPLYGHAASINSVRRAVAIVGMVKVRNMVLALSVSRRWNTLRITRRWSPRQFNLHSLAVAVLADLLVLDLKVPYPEGAFTAGLLHDIGKLLIAIAAPDEMTRILDLREERGGSSAECELEILGVTHAEISAEILARWNLPEPIQQAVRFHHRPEQAGVPGLYLAGIIEAADWQVNRQGVGIPPVEPNPDDKRVFHDPGLQNRLGKVDEAFHTEFETLSGCI